MLNLSKNDLGIKWYSLDNILKHNVQYYMIFGERSNGKSYAVDTYIIDKFFTDGKQFVFVKRFEEDLKGKYMNEVFTPLEPYILEKYGYRLKFYRGAWLLYEDGGSEKISDCLVFGYALSLANVNRTKATSYPNVDTILFEEFMSIDCSYLNDELNLFLNLVSTVVRFRHNVKVFMLANAISKFSPYSQALGIRLHRIKKGEIILKEYKDKKGFKTRFAIERSENVNVFDNNENTSKTVYNIFGNSGVGGMITSGEFETHAYPRKVANVTFGELKKEKSEKVISKKDISTIVLRYEDYYYRIYISCIEKYILGFREIDHCSINANNTNYIINGIGYIDGIINIKNLAYYDDERINRVINIIVSTMRQKDFITLSDDDGENVVNGFRLSGINLTN
jgi:hypothetical protein